MAAASRRLCTPSLARMAETWWSTGPGRRPGSPRQAADAQPAQCRLQWRRLEPGRGRMRRPGGGGGLFPVAGAEQRLRQPPPAAGHRVDMAVGEGVDRGLPARRVGVTLEPGPLGFCLGMPTAEVHVMRQSGPVCLFRGRADPLQEPATDSDGAAQRRPSSAALPMNAALRTPQPCPPVWPPPAGMETGRRGADQVSASRARIARARAVGTSPTRR